MANRLRNLRCSGCRPMRRRRSRRKRVSSRKRSGCRRYLAGGLPAATAGISEILGRNGRADAQKMRFGPITGSLQCSTATASEFLMPVSHFPPSRADYEHAGIRNSDAPQAKLVFYGRCCTATRPCGFGLECGYFPGLRAGFCPPVLCFDEFLVCPR